MACDIFRTDDVRRLLKRRGVLFIGDSNTRCLYKDLIQLIHANDITSPSVFRSGGVNKSFMGDMVIKITDRSYGRDYIEIREFQKDNIFLKYIFVTRAYCKNVIQELKDIREGNKVAPKIILMNSFLWDLTRWGPLKEDQYKEDMVKLFKDLKRSLPSDTLVMWLSTLPVATERVKGGVFIQQVEFVKHSMRFWILEGNKFAQQLCIAFGFNLLDLHYHMRHELHRRATDGIHWEPAAVRYMTNLLLTHIALNLDEPLPGNFSSKSLDRVIESADKAEEPSEILLGKDVLEMIAENETSDGEDDATEMKPDKTKRVTKKAKRRNSKRKKEAAVINHGQTRLMEGRVEEAIGKDVMPQSYMGEQFSTFTDWNQVTNPYYYLVSSNGGYDRYDLTDRLSHSFSFNQNNLNVFSRLSQPQGSVVDNAFQSYRHQTRGYTRNHGTGNSQDNNAFQSSRNQTYYSHYF
ncbi:PC-esterase domain-containing protein 1A-like [Macrobrachium nipponense]|uniref:PC-esterase domain-containing protein 1A-like n=1 Tax=Macrobrachium nipponense TaxID=159736 RepID=UPI0030C7CFB7